jgi:hypothetical protein
MATSSVNIYSNCGIPPYTAGCILYLDAALTVTAPNGYYHINGTCYEVFGNHGSNANGVISAANVCIPPPSSNGSGFKLDAYDDVATFKYTDTNDIVQNISTSPGLAAYVCCKCGTSPKKTNPNGLITNFPSYCNC